MKFSSLLAMLALTGFVSTVAAEPFCMLLETAKVGELPIGWTETKTGTGPGSVWKIVEDKTCKNGKVLAQTSSEGPSRVFNLCVAQDTSFSDVDIELALMAVGGEKDQGGGPVWRYLDANNYYVARVNPLEDNYRVYKVVQGKRIELGTIDLDIPAGRWHHLRVVHYRDHVLCFLNGTLRLEVHDSTFPKAGKVGLWTKADAVTAFSGLTAREINADIKSGHLATDREHPGLPHVMQPARTVFSGGEPEGAGGFKSLQRMGIKTIVSVDATPPNVEEAHNHRLRAIHIPLGYNGIPQDAKASIAAVIRETEGAVYFYCHHGVHRAPAAAAIACQSSGKFDRQQALDFLRLAGTGRAYRGLWCDVESFTMPPKGAHLPELVEAAEVTPLARIMARIERTFDNLRRCREAQWHSLEKRTGLDVLHEAKVFHESFLRAENMRSQHGDTEFKKHLKEAADLTGQLDEFLQAGKKELATKQMTKIRQSCSQCHEACRD